MSSGGGAGVGARGNPCPVRAHVLVGCKVIRHGCICDLVVSVRVLRLFHNN